MPDMGIGTLGSACIKQKFRWLLKIEGVSGEAAQGVNALPPEKSARPSLSFKEIEAQHLNETVYFAGKPEWKPISLVLYDLVTNDNPILNWLKEQYEVTQDKATWKVPTGQGVLGGWKRDATLEMYNGCGDLLERWVYENAWPNSIEWGDLDMSSSEYVTVDLTLRYDRAYYDKS
jgi:hypothetical protein